MIAANRLTGVKEGAGFHTLETDGPAVRLHFLTDDIVRIRASFDRAFAEESYTLVLTAWEDRLDAMLAGERRRVEPLMPEPQDEGERLVFATKSLRFIVFKNPFGIEIRDLEDRRLHAGLRGRTFVQDHLGRVWHYKERGEDDRYYGFGETTGPLDKAGRRVRLSPKDAIGYDAEHTSCLYKHIPFYISLEGASRRASGLFYHNAWDAEFDMGSEISGYWPRYTSYCAEGGDLDVFFINGPTIAEVVERYTDLTGKTVMPTRASLGHLGSTMYYVELEKDCDEAIIGFIEKTREEGIPIDGFQLSSGYTVGPGNKRYVFTWNATRFKDPSSFFARMNELGAPVSPNIKPGILLDHPHYDDFAKAGGFIRDPHEDKPYVDRWWGGPGSFVDFTHPKGREVWKNFIIGALASKGVSSIWNDNCEYELTDRLARCHGDGAEKPAGAVRNIQANLMAMTSHLALEESRPAERPYVLCRSGGAGIQRYAQTWAGDNFTSFKTLRFNIATILGMGLSGVANQGCDTAGFAGPRPGPELLVRWVQNGIFQPHFVIHSANSDNTVTEPWMYGEPYTSLIRQAIGLRYSLIPYLYSLMRQAHVTGAPIMCPLVYAFQEDPRCDGEDISFMFGPSILVANVIEEGAKTRTLYLPAGCDWFDWATRQRYAGGQEITLDVDLASIPLFIRDGAIVPTAPGLASLRRDDEAAILEWVVTPGRDASFTLYEDDGVSNAYEDGAFLETRVDLRAGARTILTFNRRGRYASPIKTMVLDVVNERRGAYWVSVAGRRIPQFLDRRKWAAADDGWIYDAARAAVRVKYPNPDGDYEVVVSFETFDLIGMDG
jgi:alpha-glucosidase